MPNLLRQLIAELTGSDAPVPRTPRRRDAERTLGRLSAGIGRADPAADATLRSIRGQDITIQLIDESVRRALPGQAVAVVPRVRVTDGGANRRTDHRVSFVVTRGNGSVDVGSAIPVVQGQHAVAGPGEWVLGDEGDNELTIIVGSRQIVVRGVAGGRLEAESAVLQNGQPGNDVADEPSVAVLDGVGNPIGNVNVSFEVVEGGGQVADAVAQTDAATGVATCGAWTLGAGGRNRVIARAGIYEIEFVANAA